MDIIIASLVLKTLIAIFAFPWVAKGCEDAYTYWKKHHHLKNGVFTILCSLTIWVLLDQCVNGIDKFLLTDV